MPAGCESVSPTAATKLWCRYLQTVAANLLAVQTMPPLARSSLPRSSRGRVFSLSREPLIGTRWSAPRWPGFHRIALLSAGGSPRGRSGPGSDRFGEAQVLSLSFLPLARVARASRVSASTEEVASGIPCPTQGQGGGRPKFSARCIMQCA